MRVVARVRPLDSGLSCVDVVDETTVRVVPPTGTRAFAKTVSNGKNSETYRLEWRGKTSATTPGRNMSTPVTRPQVFTLDRIFSPTQSQECVFEQCTESMVHAAVQGYHSTVFAYGLVA